MNPILDELHAVREKLLLDAGGTLDALVDRLQAEEHNSDRPRYETRRTKRSTGAAVDTGSGIPSHTPPPG
ncbi:MAG: hypothetical protein O3B13_19715 [Planctomycetota bacterium]|nr:hypothetical protein [Planctomycetota bacterium]